MKDNPQDNKDDVNDNDNDTDISRVDITDKDQSAQGNEENFKKRFDKLTSLADECFEELNNYYNKIYCDDE